MKEVARTSVRSLREIYDSVCFTNPRLSVKILWPRMEAAMSKSRSTMIPKNPTDFNDVIRLLVASPIHNYNLKSTLTTTDENGKEDGALIFASARSLQVLNDSQIKVIQADGTFKCVPDKNTGF